MFERLVPAMSSLAIAPLDTVSVKVNRSPAGETTSIVTIRSPRLFISNEYLKSVVTKLSGLRSDPVSAAENPLPK